MNYRPNPLLYGAEEEFYGSFKIVAVLRDAVDHLLLAQAVEEAMVRYPYFCVRPVREGERLVLQSNPQPVPTFPDGRVVLLGSVEACGHLLTFGCENNRIHLNCSHYIADGMGIAPVLKTVLYLYLSRRYGTEGLEASGITLPDSAVSCEEYSYPFPEGPVEVEAMFLPKAPPAQVYELDEKAFQGESLYAYHLHIPQKAMMGKANPSDGSPISYLSVMLYRALCALDPHLDLPVTVHVQHQYRSVLKTPQNRHSLVSYLPVVLYPKAKQWQVEHQNTALRGQVLLGMETAAEWQAINRLLAVIPEENAMSYEEKKQAMRQYARDSIANKTFGISYVGKMDWSGMERYLEDVWVYIGEKHTPNMLLMEVMTLGEDFSLTFMQSGRGRRYVDAFMQQLQSLEIPVALLGEDEYRLCGTVIPE